MIILTHSSNDPSYELGLNKLELYSVLGILVVNCRFSKLDKFNTYLHKITEKTTTGLIYDEKAERIKNKYVLRNQVFYEKNTTENSRFRYYVKERKFQLI
nr:hypothetical protein [Candidatus Neomarinimicrobiota bacterium]